MESGYLTTLSSKGQLTLPKSLREKLKFQESQRLLIEETEGGLLIKKAVVHESDEKLEEIQWDELKKLASAKGKVYKSGDAFLRSLKSK